MKRLRYKHGYILLDALVSVLILSVAIVFLARSFIIPIKASQYTIKHSKAISILNNKLAEIDIGLTEPGSSGFEQENYQEFYWATELITNHSNLQEIKIIVSWDERKSTKKVYGTTYRYVFEKR